MSLINLQVALYFTGEAAISDLVARLRELIPILNSELGINLVPLDETDAEIVGGNETLLEQNGKQFFLLYHETQAFYDTDEATLHISFIDDYPQATALHILPELIEPTREQTNFVWSRMLSLTRVLAIHMQPLIAQINGLDDEVGGQVISAKTIRANAYPDFFTPYTYLDQSLMDDPTARRLEAAGAYKVERLPSGWALQFVESLYTTPPPQLMKALGELHGSRRGFYKQTVVAED